jgi:hypothetical protein
MFLERQTVNVRILRSRTVTYILPDRSVHSTQSPACVCVCVRANSTDVDADCNINVRTCTQHVTRNSKHVRPSPSAVSCGSDRRYIAELTAASSKTDACIEGSDEGKANVKLHPVRLEGVCGEQQFSSFYSEPEH